MKQSSTEPKVERGFFAATPRIVRTQYKELSHADKWLYVCLKDICGDKGMCYRSLKSLSQETDLSTGSLSTGIRSLHNAGLIHAEKKRRINLPTAKEVWHISIVDIWQLNAAYCADNVQNLNDVPDNVQELNDNVQNLNDSSPERSTIEPKRSKFDDRRRTPEEDYLEERTEEEEREKVANATAPAQIHISEVSQDDEEDTKKRRAFMAKVHKIVAQANNGTRTPATKVTIPKRPTQKPITMEPVIPDNVLAILDRWDSIHGKPAPRTPKAIQAAQLLTVCDPSSEDLKKCQDWLYTTDRPGKPWYRSHGVHLPDIAENIGKWQSLQEAPPQTSGSNGHSPNNGKMDYNAAIMDTSQNFIKATPESIAEDERRLAEKKARMGAKR